MPSDVDLDLQSTKFESALADAKKLLRQRVEGAPFNEFNVRGKLYDMAHVLAPNARRGEIDTIKEWLLPEVGEKALDIAAGSGFLTKNLQKWTTVPVVAVDPSYSQLMALKRHAPQTTLVHAYPDDPRALLQYGDGHFDFATSLGAIHHIQNQKGMLTNVARLLRDGGRFVFADVCGGTLLSKHFDEVVTQKCLTGHTAIWLTPTRVSELIEDLPFTVARAEIVPLYMRFTSETQMYLFFKGLHAYDLPKEEVVGDLSTVLGVTRVEGEIHLNWPLLFVALQKN